jgi:hypothetical protein
MYNLTAIVREAINLAIPYSYKLEIYKESLQIYAITGLFSPTLFVITNQC